ncbi:MAG: ABC transporter permease [Tissierellia bacterium]|jgi:D-methionine transport system permease protein|nr:ABC transporter permease [Tissierellia bacterium]
MWAIETIIEILQENMQMLSKETLNTLYMTFVSSLFAYIFALPLGVALVVTKKDGLHPMGFLNRFLDIVVNIGRSVPFLILLVTIQPLTTLIAGKSYGPTATIVPLVVASTPFIARLIESSLQEVDHGVIEAAQSMGASIPTIILKVLIPEAKTSMIVGGTIAIGTILSYSAMAGFVGGGGLGDVAIRYGYYRYEADIMIITVILMVILVQVLQLIGMKIARKTDKRAI